MNEKTENTVKNSVSKYTKDQLLNSKKWRGYRDLINALFDDNKSYSAAEIQGIIDKYLKGKVV